MKLPSFALLKNKKVRYVLMAAAALGAIWYFFFLDKKPAQETQVVRRADFVQEVSVSGKVVSQQNIDLSFEQAGIVRGVHVGVGDTVAAGTLVANQDTAQLSAQLAGMQAGIDLQQAKLSQLLAGSAPEDVKVKEDAVASARQDLQNSYASAILDITSAYNTVYNAYNTVAYTKTAYFGRQDQAGIKMDQMKYEVSISAQNVQTALDSARAAAGNIDAALQKTASELTGVYNNLKTVRELADEGTYYASVSTADKTSLDTQRANVNTAISAIVTAQQDIASDKAALLKAESELTAIKAAPRDTDIAVYQAQIKQAQAQTQEIHAQIRKKQIIAPIAGTISVVNAKTGAITGAGEIAVSLISAGKFQVESYVPQIYVALVKPGDTAKVQLDAYGSDALFAAKVISVDPAETIKDGVSTYKTLLELDDAKMQIKNGMTANVIITTEKKTGVIAVPQGIVISRDGKKFVKVKAGESIMEREITLGKVSSDGRVEVLAGLQDGETVVIR